MAPRRLSIDAHVGFDGCVEQNRFASYHARIMPSAGKHTLVRRIADSTSATIGILAALAMVSPTPCLAQQEFILTDQDEWKQTARLDLTTPEGKLAEGKRLLAASQTDEAIQLASDWIDDHPQHALLADAYLLRGDALAAAGDEYEALFDYEYITRVYPGSEAFVTALEREFDIARQYADGKKRKLFGMRIVGAEDEAEEIFIRIQERLPGSRLGEEAVLALGDFYFERRNMPLAADAYDIFIENYPQSAHIDRARRRLIYSHMATFKGPEFDAAGLREARLRLEELRTIRPVEAQRMGAEALMIGIDERLAEKNLTTAQWYLRTGDPIAAEQTIRRLIKQYPRTIAAADALRLIPGILPRLPARIADEVTPMYEAARAAQASD